MNKRMHNNILEKTVQEIRIEDGIILMFPLFPSFGNPQYAIGSVFCLENSFLTAPSPPEWGARGISHPSWVPPDHEDYLIYIAPGNFCVNFGIAFSFIFQ